MVVIVIMVVIVTVVMIPVVVVIVPRFDVDPALTREATGPEGDHQNGQAERDDRGVEGLGHGPASAIDVPPDLVAAGLPASIATERRSGAPACPEGQGGTSLLCRGEVHLWPEESRGIETPS